MAPIFASPVPYGRWVERAKTTDLKKKLNILKPWILANKYNKINIQVPDYK